MPALMKGNVWHERKDAKDRKGNPIVQYPVVVEDKHDEIRCRVLVFREAVDFLSYADKPLANMEQFEAGFSALSAATGHEEFDVGFEVGGNFNASYRWVRSTRGLPADLREASTRFLLFGLPEMEGYALAQMDSERRRVQAAAEECGLTLDLPRSRVCQNEQEVYSAYLNARYYGREGVMVKQPHMTYERKRTDGWLKLKPENDADGRITALHEAVCGKDQPELGLRDGDKLGRIGSVTLALEDGSEATPHGIPHGLGSDMLKHPGKYMGQWATFKFMERDRQGGYRHPVWGRLREAKA